MNARVRVSEIAEIRPGYLARKGVKSAVDGAHYLLQIRDFNENRTTFTPESLVRFSAEPLSSARPLEAGEVIFLAKGGGNFAYAVSNIPSFTLAASYFFVLRPCARVLPAYLAWFLNQPDTLRTLARSATSGAHTSVVRRADLEDIEIPVPPIPRQRVIAELDSLRHEEHDLLCELVHKKKELISAVCNTVAYSGNTTGERL